MQTWLNAPQPSPVLDDKISIRCDRLTCENKGGVIMYVPCQIYPTNIQRFATSGIEALSTTICIENLGKLQIAVVYRSSNILLGTLIALMNRLLNHVSLWNLPCLYWEI